MYQIPNIQHKFEALSLLLSTIRSIAFSDHLEEPRSSGFEDTTKFLIATHALLTKDVDLKALLRPGTGSLDGFYLPFTVRSYLGRHEFQLCLLDADGLRSQAAMVSDEAAAWPSPGYFSLALRRPGVIPYMQRFFISSDVVRLEQSALHIDGSCHSLTTMDVSLSKQRWKFVYAAHPSLQSAALERQQPGFPSDVVIYEGSYSPPENAGAKVLSLVKKPFVQQTSGDKIDFLFSAGDWGLYQGTKKNEAGAFACSALHLSTIRAFIVPRKHPCFLDTLGDAQVREVAYSAHDHSDNKRALRLLLELEAAQ